MSLKALLDKLHSKFTGHKELLTEYVSRSGFEEKMNSRMRIAKKKIRKPFSTIDHVKWALDGIKNERFTVDDFFLRLYARKRWEDDFYPGSSYSKNKAKEKEDGIVDVFGGGFDFGFKGDIAIGIEKGIDFGEGLEFEGDFEELEELEGLEGLEGFEGLFEQQPPVYNAVSPTPLIIDEVSVALMQLYPQHTMQTIKRKIQAALAEEPGEENVKYYRVDAGGFTPTAVEMHVGDLVAVSGDGRARISGVVTEDDALCYFVEITKESFIEA